MKKQLFILFTVLNLVSIGNANYEDAFFAIRNGQSIDMSTQKTWTSEEMSTINYVKDLAEKTIDGRDSRLAELVQEKYPILREALNRGDFGELKNAFIENVKMPQYTADSLVRILEKGKLPKLVKTVVNGMDYKTALRMASFGRNIKSLNKASLAKQEPIQTQKLKVFLRSVLDK